MNHLSLLGIKWIFLHLIFKETKKKFIRTFFLNYVFELHQSHNHRFDHMNTDSPFYLPICSQRLSTTPPPLPHPPTLLKLTSVLPFLAHLPLPRVTSSLFLENFTWVMFYYARCSEDLRSSTYCCQCGSAKVSLQRKKYRWKPPSVCLSVFFFFF